MSFVQCAKAWLLGLFGNKGKLEVKHLGFASFDRRIPVIDVSSALMRFSLAKGESLFPLNQYVGYCGPLTERTPWWREIFLEWANVNFAVATPESSSVLETISKFYRELLCLSPTLQAYACGTGSHANRTAMQMMADDFPNGLVLCTSIAHSSIRSGHNIPVEVLKVKKVGAGYSVPACDVIKLINERPTVRMLVVTLGATHSGDLDISGITPEFVTFLAIKGVRIHVDATLGAGRGALLPSFALERRMVLNALQLLKPRTLAVGVYKAVGAISCSLLWVELSDVTQYRQLYFSSGTGLKETSIAALPFVLAAEVIKRTPLPMLQFLMLMAHCSTVQFFHSVRSTLSRYLNLKLGEVVSHVSIDSVFIEVRERTMVVELLKQAGLDVAYAEFETNDGLVSGIRVVFRPDWIWDSNFVDCLGQIVGSAILTSMGHIPVKDYAKSIKSFENGVRIFQSIRKGIDSKNFGHRFPLEFFKLAEAYGFLTLTRGEDRLVQFLKFRRELEKRGRRVYRPEDWPEKSFLDQIQGYLEALRFENG